MSDAKQHDEEDDQPSYLHAYWDEVNEMDDWDDFDEWDPDDEDNDFEYWLSECGQVPGENGFCLKAGSEECDFECPFSGDPIEVEDD